MSDKKTVEFTIRETHYYTGRIKIDPEQFEATTGSTLEDSLTADDGILEQYIFDLGTHEEFNGDVDGQTYTDFEIKEDQA